MPTMSQVFVTALAATLTLAAVATAAVTTTGGPLPLGPTGAVSAEVSADLADAAAVNAEVTAAGADGGAAGADAGAAGAGAADGEKARSLATVCAKIPQRITRLEKVQVRLHGDAGTRGSLAFLQARIDRATAEGRTDQARLLTDLLAVRRENDARLPTVLASLKDAQEVCAARSATDRS